MQQGIQHKYRFMEWLDIDGSGMVTECAIMKKTPAGDVFFFPLRSLDMVDLQRFKAIISHAEAGMYDELWRLLEQKTLGNGVNALVYFNQLVKQRTANGTILPFGTNKQSVFMAPPVEQPAPQPSTVKAAAPAQQAESFDNLAKPTAPKK